MVETAEADGIWGPPDHEDPVDGNEVVDEAAELVPALPGTGRTEDSHKGGQPGVDQLEISAEEGPCRFQKALEIITFIIMDKVAIAGLRSRRKRG